MVYLGSENKIFAWGKTNEMLAVRLKLECVIYYFIFYLFYYYIILFIIIY